MYLPDMKYNIVEAKTKIIEFKGYNVNSVIEDGEMRDMMNLSSDEYPCLYQRKPRKVYSDIYSDPQCMIAKKEKLAVIDGNNLYYNGELTGLSLSSDTPKRITAINRKICIFPDKVWLDVVDGTTGNMEYSFTAGQGVIQTIKVDSIIFSGSVDASGFSEGDAVTISGCTTNIKNNTSAVISGIEISGENTTLIFPSDSFDVPNAEESYVETGRITISRSTPDLDFVMESNNRLWGCNSEKNTIYACKLGDPTNWEYYQGTSLDSYAIEVGTDGDFTGCAPYPAHLLFF